MDTKSLDSILEVLRVGLIAYPLLILVLRLTGKRTLSKMNSFDLVVTIALGSVLASTLVTSSVSVWKGLTALTFLVCTQFLVATLAVHSATFRRMIKAEPKLLFHNGEFLEANLRAERVTHDEVIAAMRQNGHSEPSDVAAVVLETEGSLSVLTKFGSSLSNVQKPSAVEKQGNLSKPAPEPAAYP